MKLEYPKEWFLRSAAWEGEVEVGAGLPLRTASLGLPLGRLVELWRREKGWASSQFADVAGLDVSDVRRLEKEPEFQPEGEWVLKLARVFGVTEVVLCRVTGYTEPGSCVVRECEVPYGVPKENLSELDDEEREELETYRQWLREA